MEVVEGVGSSAEEDRAVALLLLLGLSLLGGTREGDEVILSVAGVPMTGVFVAVDENGKNNGVGYQRNAGYAGE